MQHKRKISVIGLGYVGLPVAVEFGKSEKVIGFDINQERVGELKQGYDRTNEVNRDDLKSADVKFTTNAEDLKSADFHIIAVPTPIDAAKTPNLDALRGASITIGRQIKKGDIVVYESTVYPGATEEECIPVLEEESGLIAGKDFFVGYSPERINPGDQVHTFSTILKVVSGQDKQTLDIVANVYSSVVKAGVYKAASIKVAEAAKVIENTQRDVNIALMNELALIFEKLGIDSGDVLDAAGTKWNFLPFQPGLAGGHCIGVDPYYLTYKAAVAGYLPQVILSGRSINDGMGAFVASKIVKALIKRGNNVKDATVTVLGITFKENVPDTRNTRVIDIVNELLEYDINVQIHDPEADADEALHEYEVTLVDYDDLKPADAIILAVGHQSFVDRGWQIAELLKENTGVVFDVNRVLNRQAKPAMIELKRL